MPLPIKSRYTITEAAKFIATVSGEPVTQSQILDWGSQGFYRLYAPLKWAAVRQVGETDIARIEDVLVEVRLSNGQAATLGRGERVGFTTCWRDGIEFNFMRERGYDQNSHIGTNWRRDTPYWSVAGLVLLGTELTAFTATLTAPARSPAAKGEAVPVEQATRPPEAKGEAVPGTSPSGDEIPGKMPNTTIGKLAIKAAWLIECETGKRATAEQVIEKLQSWVDHKDNPEAVTELTEKIPNGVKWVTRAGKKRPYDIGACQKALETWNKSRD